MGLVKTSRVRRAGPGLHGPWSVVGWGLCNPGPAPCTLVVLVIVPEQVLPRRTESETEVLRCGPRHDTQLSPSVDDTPTARPIELQGWSSSDWY